MKTESNGNKINQEENELRIRYWTLKETESTEYLYTKILPLIDFDYEENKLITKWIRGNLS